MKTYSVKIEFSRSLDYDGLSDEVIIWALKRYKEKRDTRRRLLNINLSHDGNVAFCGIQILC